MPCKKIYIKKENLRAAAAVQARPRGAVHRQLEKGAHFARFGCIFQERQKILDDASKISSSSTSSKAPADSAPAAKQAKPSSDEIKETIPDPTTESQSKKDEADKNLSDDEVVSWSYVLNIHSAILFFSCHTDIPFFFLSFLCLFVYLFFLFIYMFSFFSFCHFQTLKI